LRYDFYYENGDGPFLQNFVYLVNYMASHPWRPLSNLKVGVSTFNTTILFQFQQYVRQVMKGRIERYMSRSA
jgi:hypothetical protein